jgi:hypothetical protein
MRTGKEKREANQENIKAHMESTKKRWMPFKERQRLTNKRWKTAMK